MSTSSADGTGAARTISDASHPLRAPLALRPVSTHHADGTFSASASVSANSESEPELAQEGKRELSNSSLVVDVSRDLNLDREDRDLSQRSSSSPLPLPFPELPDEEDALSVSSLGTDDLRSMLPPGSDAGTSASGSSVSGRGRGSLAGIRIGRGSGADNDHDHDHDDDNAGSGSPRSRPWSRNSLLSTGASSSSGSGRSDGLLSLPLSLSSGSEGEDDEDDDYAFVHVDLHRERDHDHDRDSRSARHRWHRSSSGSQRERPTEPSTAHYGDSSAFESDLDLDLHRTREREREREATNATIGSVGTLRSSRASMTVHGSVLRVPTSPSSSSASFAAVAGPALQASSGDVQRQHGTATSATSDSGAWRETDWDGEREQERDPDPYNGHLDLSGLSESAFAFPHLPRPAHSPRASRSERDATETHARADDHTPQSDGTTPLSNSRATIGLARHGDGTEDRAREIATGTSMSTSMRSTDPRLRSNMHQFRAGQHELERDLAASISGESDYSIVSQTLSAAYERHERDEQLQLQLPLREVSIEAIGQHGLAHAAECRTPPPPALVAAAGHGSEHGRHMGFIPLRTPWTPTRTATTNAGTISPETRSRMGSLSEGNSNDDVRKVPEGLVARRADNDNDGAQTEGGAKLARSIFVDDEEITQVKEEQERLDVSALMPGFLDHVRAHQSPHGAIERTLAGAVKAGAAQLPTRCRPFPVVFLHAQAQEAREEALVERIVEMVESSADAAGLHGIEVSLRLHCYMSGLYVPA